MECPEQGAFPVTEQDRPKLLAHIDTPAFMGLGSAEVAHVVMPLHQDETVLIVLWFPRTEYHPT
jgi:hypothetical protein